MRGLVEDLTYGLRLMLKRPGFTAIAVLTLMLGIGANTAIFSVTDKLLIRSLPVREPARLVLINSVSVSPYFVGNAFSYPEFTDYRDQVRVLSGLLAFSTTQLQMKSNDRVERIRGEYVSGNYFDVMGVGAAHGRTFSPEEDKVPGNQPVAVISDQFWRTRFGADPNIVGKTVTINDVPLTVIGIAPPSFTGMVLEEPTQMWVPVLMHPQLEKSKFIEDRNARWLVLLGRINSGTSEALAAAEMDVVVQQIKDAHTPPGTVTKGLPFSEQHIQFEPGGRGISIFRKKFSSPLKLLMAIVGLVLLIACANVAGLLLARGVSRRKEMAIRLALGASGWRLTRQVLTESLLLAGAGGAAGLLVAPWLVMLLVKTQSMLDVAHLLTDVVDRRLLVFTALITLIAGMVFGVVPAWSSSRTNLTPALKSDGGVERQRDRRFNFRTFLVVGQLALAIVVLIGAGLCIKSLRNLLAIDPGYRAEHVLIVPLQLDKKAYSEERGRAFRREFIRRLSSLPGVEEVSYGLVTPLSGSRFMSSIFVEGHQPLPDEQMAFDTNSVGPGYHEAMGVDIVEGRGFNEQDREGAPGVVIINEAMARRLFPGERALGRKVRLGTNKPALEIVGIERDVKYHELTENPLPHFDLPSLQRGYEEYTNIVVRTHGRAADLTGAVRGELGAMDNSLESDEIKPMSDQIAAALAPMRLASTLIATLGLVALTLACIGLYGIMAWLVGRRTHEIGIRMALGAQRGDVVRLIVKQGMLVAVIGTAAGLVAAFISTRLIDSLLYGVSGTDRSTFACIAVLLLGVALLACYMPARRAARVDPIEALRYE